MDDGYIGDSAARYSTLIIAGLGPGSLAGAPSKTLEHLRSPDVTVVVRTLQHPAAEELAGERSVISCDDLYDNAETFDDVYDGIVDRVMNLASDGKVVYAVPGSPLYAEKTVVKLRKEASRRGIQLTILLASSFLDEVFAALEVDPAATGFQVLDGRDLPSPLILHLATVVFHVDRPLILADVLSKLGRTLPDDCSITVLSELGGPDASVETFALLDVPPEAAGLRTSLFFTPPPVGIVGAIQTVHQLRHECPWDKEQTHDSLASHVVEETYELVEAIGHLPAGSPDVEEPDYGAYAEVEDELGDVLMQVLFHAELAEEAGAFDIEDVAETLRRKLVHRHPHVFAPPGADAPIDVADADEVLENWRAIKADDKPLESLMDGIPDSFPGLLRALKLQNRASRVGFDWPSARAVVGDVEEELAELVEVIDDQSAAESELGDVLFAVVNLARHLDVDPEVSLRRAVSRFESRFRHIEELAGGESGLKGLDEAEMDRLWEKAKAEERAEE